MNRKEEGGEPEREMNRKEVENGARGSEQERELNRTEVENPAGN